MSVYVEKRAHIRMPAPTGSASLRAPGLPALNCKLTNISEGGCCVSFVTSEIWSPQRFSRPGFAVNLLMNLPGCLENFDINSDVRHFRHGQNSDGKMEAGLQFRAMDEKRLKMFKMALVKMAAERLRAGRPSHGTAASFQKPAIQPGQSSQSGIQNHSGSRVGGVSWKEQFKGMRLGEVLVRMGKLSEEQAETAAAESRRWRERIGQYLLRKNLITDMELCRALALSSGLPTTDLTDVSIKPSLWQVFSPEIMSRYEFVPFDLSDQVLCIAATAPIGDAALAEMRRICNRKIEVFLTQEETVKRLLQKSAPRATKMIKNRRHPRFSFPLPVFYHYCMSAGERMEDINYNGQTINISEGGLKIEGPVADFGEIGDLNVYGLYLNVSISFKPYDFSALCKLVYINKKEKLTREKYFWEMGLRIMDITSSSRSEYAQILKMAEKVSGAGSM